MNLACTPSIRIPLVNRQTPLDPRAVTMEAVLNLLSLTQFVTFVLLYLGYDHRLIYECTQCGNCGCPSFAEDVIGHEIPEEVFIHLELHAQLCAGKYGEKSVK